MLLCPLAVSGCGKTIVAEPLTVPKVRADLMIDPGESTCVLPRRDLYHPGELGAYRACVESERDHLRKRLLGLQIATRKREKVIDRALRAQKGQTS